MHSGVLVGSVNEMMLMSVDNYETDDYMNEYIDDMSGKPLIPSLVREARGEEMGKFSQHNV